MQNQMITRENNVVSTFSATNSLRVLTGQTFSVQEVADAAEGQLRILLTSNDHVVELASLTGLRWSVRVLRRGGRVLAETAKRYSFDGVLLAAADFVEADLVDQEKAGFRTYPSGGVYCPECASATEETGTRFEGEALCCNCGLGTDGQRVPGHAGYHVWVADEISDSELATFCAVEAANNLETVMIQKDRIAELQRQVDRLVRERDEARRIGMEQNEARVKAAQDLDTTARLLGESLAENTKAQKELQHLRRTR